jgi:hypothetical protein
MKRAQLTTQRLETSAVESGGTQRSHASHRCIVATRRFVRSTHQQETKPNFNANRKLLSLRTKRIYRLMTGNDQSELTNTCATLSKSAMPVPTNARSCDVRRTSSANVCTRCTSMSSRNRLVPRSLSDLRIFTLFISEFDD